MTKWRIKACPKCGGDMFIDRDLDSWYEQCLQCSYRVELKTMNKVKEPALTGAISPERHPEPEKDTA
jgi:ribosomal protein S27AE